jgi:hypothetical protein
MLTSHRSTQKAEPFQNDVQPRCAEWKGGIVVEPAEALPPSSIICTTPGESLGTRPLRLLGRPRFVELALASGACSDTVGRPVDELSGSLAGREERTPLRLRGQH